MARYLQFLGSDGISVALSSVKFEPNEQINYLFSLESSYVNNNNIVIPSLVNTVEEQQKTLEGKGTVASVTAGTGMTQIGTDTFNPTLNVIGGDGITANADDITVDSTVVRTTGSQTIAGDKSFSNDVSIDGDITGGSAFFSSVSALTANFLQTIISSTSALSVVNAGTGPPLYVQQDGNEPIAHFIDKTGDDIVFADNGFVGIGTFNPAEKLTVSGNISANGSLSATGNATFTGNVGIGTDSQVGKLHVEQLDNNEDALVLKGGGGSGSVQGNVSLSMSHFKGDTNPAVRIMAEERAAADWRANLLFLLRDVSSDAAPTEKMRITYDGNVGIGTTSPSSLLHLASTGPAVLTIEADTDNATETDNARIVLKQDGGIVVGRIGYENNTNALEIINQFGDSLSLGTTNTKRLLINSSGDIGIGTTSPTEKLHVVGKVLADNLFTPQWVTPLMLGACTTSTANSGSVTNEGRGVGFGVGSQATSTAAVRLDRYFAAARGSGQTTRLDYWNTIVGVSFQRVIPDDTEFFIEIGVGNSPVGPPSDSDKGIFFCLKKVSGAYTYDIRHNRGTAETNTTAVDQSTSMSISFDYSVEIRTLRTGTLQLYINGVGDEPTLVQEFTGLTFGQNGTGSQHQVWIGYRSIGYTGSTYTSGANRAYVGYWK